MTYFIYLFICVYDGLFFYLLDGVRS